jgi:FtsP/CotA-like multicopper oxidase with cupredoxin domain
MALIRQNRHRARLFVLMIVCLFLAALVSRASESARATSGGSSYDIPVVTDTNPAANIVETTITADETTVDIGNGVTAHAQTFNGAIPGPTFQLNVGDTVIVHFKNEMSTVTGIHWHGIELENNMDGTPFTQDQVAPGDSFLYKFKVSRPGIFWYHPHHHSSTNQVFKGLYGMILIKDPNEAVLPAGTLPSAADTKPLVFSDTTVCKAPGSNDADMYDVTPPTAPWVNGPDLPAQSPPTPPVALCETSPVNEDATAGPPFAEHDIPNIQQIGASRTNEGQTVLTNGKNVGGRAGSPHSFGPPIGALDAGAQTLDVQAGQGLRLPLLNASAIRYFRLRLTDDTGAMIPLVRIGGEGGLLNQAVIEGNMQPVPPGTLDTGYDFGEIVLPPGSRADVVAAIPASATGVLTLWTEDYSRTGQGFSNIPTVPVMHLNVTGAASSTYTIGNGTPLASLGTAVVTLGPASGSILDPASFSPAKLGNPSQNITLIATGGGVNVDGVVGTHDVSPPYTGADHLGSTRYAKLGDTLQLSVTNQSGAHHPFHLHGFSMQPISLTPDATHPTDPSFTWPYPEFRDNIDIPGHYVLTFRIKLEDRTLADGVTLGGGLGRWVFHCHIFFHATLGMLSEVVVTDANGNEAPDVDANDPVVEVANSGDTATMDGTFADRDGDAVTLTASVGTVTQGAGTWHWENMATSSQFVYITATDSNGHKDQAVFEQQLINTPPDCSTVVATPNRLWAPDHRLVTVTLSGATDADGDPVTLTVTGVTQDEPLNGMGDGDTAPDAVLILGHSNQVKLRAERRATSDGRVYRITFSGDDGQGGSCTGTTTVIVPRNEGDTTAVDSGLIINSL